MVITSTTRGRWDFQWIQKTKLELGNAAGAGFPRVNGILDYIRALVGFMMDMVNKTRLHKNDWQRTVFVEAGGISITDFNPSDDQVNTLIADGHKRMATYLEWLRNTNLRYRVSNTGPIPMARPTRGWIGVTAADRA